MRSIPVPMRVIAKKRCRAMVEPPEKGERATLNPNLSTRLNLLFSIRPLAAGWLLLVEEGERRCLGKPNGGGSHEEYALAPEVTQLLRPSKAYVKSG
jgi:hypothetical protein